MKNFILGSLLIMALYACDKNDCPYDDERLCDPLLRDSILNQDPDTSNNGGDDAVKKVLLEDFTGFRCTNCLPAINTAEQLENQWGDRLIVIAYHVTNEFAAPTNNPPGLYVTDMRTDEGLELLIDFNIPGLPNGAVNRTDFGTGIAQSAGGWADLVELEMEEEPVASVSFGDVSYNATNATASFEVTVSPLVEVDSDWFLAVGVYENGIIDAQKNGTEDLYPFTHNHVFRTYVNGTYGELAVSALNPVEIGDEVNFDFQVTADGEWMPENCYLFAVLRNSQTEEVIGCDKTSFFPQ